MLPFETWFWWGWRLAHATPPLLPTFETWFFLALYLYTICTSAVLLLDKLEDRRQR